MQVGFGGATDLRKLAASFPNMACFRAPRSVLDLATWATACKAWERNISDPITMEIPSDASRSPKKNSRRRGQSRSLAGLVRALLGRELDKTEQCSAWIQRPLTDAQKHYAALDATVVVKLASELAQMSDTHTGSKSSRPSTTTNANSQSFQRHVAHFQFTMVDDEDSARRVKAKALYLGQGLISCHRDSSDGFLNGVSNCDSGEKNTTEMAKDNDVDRSADAVGAGTEIRVEVVWIAAQSWPAYGAGPSKAPPRPPSPPSRTSAVGTYVDKSGVLRLAAEDLRTKDAVALALADAETAADSSDATTLESVHTGSPEGGSIIQYTGKDVATSLKLGWPVGASKDRVMEALVPPNVQAAPPPPPLDRALRVNDGTKNPDAMMSPQRVRVEFNPRSGLVECADAVVLFVNAIEAGSGAGSKYPNEWARDGRQLSFFLRSLQWRGGSTPLAARLLSAGQSSEEANNHGADSTGGSAVLHEVNEQGATTNNNTDNRSPLAGSVLLFARSNSGSGRKSAPFIFCGRCTVTEAPSSSAPSFSSNSNNPGSDSVNNNGGSANQGGASGDLVELHLELLDFALANQAPPFQQLVAGTEAAATITTTSEKELSSYKKGISNAAPRSSSSSTEHQDLNEATASRFRNQEGSSNKFSDADENSGSYSNSGEGLDDDALAQVALARQVLHGDIIGACQVALNQAHTRPERRSLEAGVAALKVALARGGGNQDVDAAMDALEAAASKLGLL